MNYKSILTILDTSPECTAWVKFAIELAKKHNARLVGVAPRELASSLTMGEMVAIDSAWIVNLQENIDRESQSAKSSFVQLCGSENFQQYEAKIVPGSDYIAMKHEAVNSDLIVLGQHFNDFQGSRTGLVESLLMSTARPLVIVPGVGSYTAETGNILVAWRDSRESAMAIRQSIPQLVGAKKVQIVSVDRHEIDSGKEEKLQELVKYLGLNDINATYKSIVTSMDAGNALLSHACDYEANLLVMGGYGHTRIKEWALGGVTRTILQSMTLPVLMAH